MYNLNRFRRLIRIGEPKKPNKGVTLIMVAGVLAILAAMGAGFYTLTISQNKSAVRYSDSVRADMMARAGMSDAIARLQEQAFYKTEDPTDGWYQTDWLHAATRHVSYPAKNTTAGSTEQYASYSRMLGGTIDGTNSRFSLDIADTSGRINVNAGDNLGVLLDNLCRVIGPPLIAANLDALQPRVWSQNGAPAGMFDTAQNKDDNSAHTDLYYALDNTNHQTAGADGSALYGDGYAIAGYRGRNGRFARLEDVKLALSTVYHPGHPELEELERSVKFNAIRDYITIDSWIDTNTICVGKFEWAEDTYRCIDRDKSWIASVDINGKHIEDGQNSRGSLVGSYISVINGHGAGQLRRIKENGIDWIQVDQPFVINPGPCSAYMIISREDAMLTPKNDLKGQIQLSPDGHLFDDPNINYKKYPLCIHRAPININTASDKVLIAMFMGINVQHGTPLAVGTDADENKITDVQSAKSWVQPDVLQLFPQGIPSENGLKRSPQNTGKPALNRPEPWTDAVNFGYIDNYKSLTAPNYVPMGGVCNEAHELAYRVIFARQADIDTKTNLPKRNEIDPNVLTFKAARGPFKSWDDFFFRVVQPWDDYRLANGPKDISTGLPKRFSLAPMIMAAFNSNTDLLKFNPNIEWIDRWGRNFTSMEPVITGTSFKGTGPLMTGKPEFAKGLFVGPTVKGAPTVSSQPQPSKTNANPPYVAPTGQFYYIRNMRYRFNEMIDKSDLNRSTTEFTMDAGGVYEIHSVGQVALGGEIRAERKLEALVQVYDVWRESTQRQFVEGHFNIAAQKGINGQNLSGRTDRGRITRDADNCLEDPAGDYKTLDTQPEPLVPLKYQLNNKEGGGFYECVDGDSKGTTGPPPKDAYGNLKTPWNNIGSAKNFQVPDVIANRVLPAGYDGQLVLATNTLVFDSFEKNKNPTSHYDTFLASFNGDLDTDTCLGNGREQAKTPLNPAFRVCDTISLLGLLNDTEIDMDSYSVEDIGLAPPNPAVGPQPKKVNPVFLLNMGASLGSNSLNAFPTSPAQMKYEYCMSCRVGDLRPDGVYLGALGVSCKDATLKYAFGAHSYWENTQSSYINGAGVFNPETTFITPPSYNSNRGGGPLGTIYHALKPFNDKVGAYNYEPGNQDGCTISMWVKTTWNVNDHQEHEFFNGSTNGIGSAARYNKLAKQGYVYQVPDPSTPTPALFYSARNVGAPFLDGTLYSAIEDMRDQGASVGIHGGTATRINNYVDLDFMNVTETPSYYMQPFRWAYVGQVHKFGTTTNLTPNTAAQAPKPQPDYVMGSAYSTVTIPVNWAENPAGTGGAKIVEANNLKFPLVFSWGTAFIPPDATGLSFYQALWNFHGINGNTASLFNYAVSADTFGFWAANTGYTGYNADGIVDRDAAKLGVKAYASNIIRPFVSTARYPEGTQFSTDNMTVINRLLPYTWAAQSNPGNLFNVLIAQPMKDVDWPLQTNGYPALSYGWLGVLANQENTGTVGWNANTDLEGQPAAYDWATTKNERQYDACFSINNTNQGYSNDVTYKPPPPPPIPQPVMPPPPPPPPGGSGPPRPTSPPPPTPIPPRPFIKKKPVEPTVSDAEVDVKAAEPAAESTAVGAEDPLAPIDGDEDPASAPTQPEIVKAEGEMRPMAAAPRSKYFQHIYKMQPCDTTMATIDEFRISRRAWTSREIQDEMTLSRYYLPTDTTGKTHVDQLPTFVSQSLIQSLEGNKVTSDDLVAVARVSWNVFTPRFMHEWKEPIKGRWEHMEIIDGKSVSVPFRGPFEYAQYNRDIDYDANKGWKGTLNPSDTYRGVKRVRSTDLNQQTSWSKGVTVDLVTAPVAKTGPFNFTTVHPLQGSVIDRTTGVAKFADTFVDPEAENCYINQSKPGQRTLVKAGELHYRVRFQYPVDRKNVDNRSTLDTVDPSKQYLLDTPVFDDISIVYIQAPKILWFKEAVE